MYSGLAVAVAVAVAVARTKSVQCAARSSPRTRRVRHERGDTIALIFSATRQLMLDDGYAAVSTRRVAKLAGLTAALVHYYFATTDDLLVALYRHASDDFHLRLMDIVKARSPVEALWALFTDAQVTSLGIEFMALANHRKAIRSELVRLGEHSRRLTAKILVPALQQAGFDSKQFPAYGVTTIFQGVARTIVMDRHVGLSLGLADAAAIMQRLVRELKADRAVPAAATAATKGLGAKVHQSRTAVPRRADSKGHDAVVQPQRLRAR